MDGFLSRLLLLGALLVAPPASAVVFTVDTTDDAVDAAIDGTCADAEGRCTLRAAVQEANATAADPDNIVLAAGTYKLSQVGAFEDAAASGDLDVTGPVTIQGAGAELTILQGKKDRILDVSGAGVFLLDLTLTKGKAPKSDDDDQAAGGAIRNTGSLELSGVVLTRNQAADDSGGIANDAGTLVLVDVTFSLNKAKDDAGALDNDGGTVSLTNVTFSKNKAGDEAGAFESEQGGTITGQNVTVSGNKAKEVGGVNAEQGGIVDLTNATITGNKSKLGGGGVQVEDGGSAVFLTNSIVAGNKKQNCSGPLTTEGGNLDSGSSCGFQAPDDQIGVADIGLDKKIRDNGGPTATHALLPGSPAIDFADDADCPVTDQRGAARFDDPDVDGDGCDSGAFERVPAS